MGQGEQEALLEALSTSIRRQTELGVQIGREVDESTRLVSRVGDKVGGTERKVERTTEAIDSFKVAPCWVVGWVSVVFLLLVLVVLLATSGGCMIVYSSQTCHDMPWGRHNASY